MPSRIRITYTPIWRDCDKPITFWEHMSLREIGEDRPFVHADWYSGRQVIRFGVSDSGRLLVGDAWDTLHADIVRCALAIGDDEQLYAGACVEQPDRRWEIRFYPLRSRHPADLSARLTTWHAFVEGAEIFERRGIWEDP
jgi:hypothetical protein